MRTKQITFVYTVVLIKGQQTSTACQGGKLTWPKMVWKFCVVLMDAEAATAAAAAALTYDTTPAYDHMLHVVCYHMRKLKCKASRFAIC